MEMGEGEGKEVKNQGCKDHCVDTERGEQVNQERERVPWLFGYKSHLSPSSLRRAEEGGRCSAEGDIGSVGSPSRNRETETGETA
ncbi:hypothetical protein FQA47_009185 [Oryzias melastigma]|uniref:Uncharacterized protein n=1 Tax=Oryzias melastigma TaxID=30732 RepID=A0A834FM19_ORYME|nr:hypothetical protein FQA47_009185 [Oryzias melastigma]